MEQRLFVYNTLTRKKEEFKALHPPHVGMYVCGPTVYSDAHMGNSRTYISFDLIFRYLTHIGYKVRYVRNITDAGHLEGDNGDIDFGIPDDTWISRKHVRLTIQEEKEEARFQLIDLNSVNGTYIHDTQTRLKPNEEFSLIDGDTFQIGKTNIVLISSVRTASEKEALEQIDRTPYQKIENITNPVTL